MDKIEIISRKILSDKKYRLEEVEFTKPGTDGKDRHSKNEVYFRPDAVAVLLVNEETEELILTKQIRLPVYLNRGGDGFLLEACAGLIDEGETPEQAAVREVSEEMGFEISSPEKIGGIFSSAGGITEFVHLFLSTVKTADKKNAGGGIDEAEDVLTVQLKFDEARAMLKNQQIDDAKTMMLLQHFFLQKS